MITLKLAQMAHGGPALGRHQGKVYFVPYALPGETVAVEAETSKKGWARARLVEVLEPSPERTAPACPHFGPDACGGCQWQHIDYPAQLLYKTDVVRDQLSRLGGLTDALVRPTLAVSEPWGYRNHVQLHSSPDGLGYVSANGRHWGSKLTNTIPSQVSTWSGTSPCCVRSKPLAFCISGAATSWPASE